MERSRRARRYSWTLCVLAGLGVSALTACPPGDENEGPMERTGKRLDQAGEVVGDELHDAGQKAGEAVEELGDEVERRTDALGNAHDVAPVDSPARTVPDRDHP